MSPTADGRFKGISVGKVWPGHRDYEPPIRTIEDANRAFLGSELWEKVLKAAEDGEVSIPVFKRKR